MRERAFHRSPPSALGRLSRSIARDEGASELGEGSGFDGGAGARHEVEIKMEVVERDQAQAKDLFRFQQMADVAA